jgi:hypothetical protein
MLLDNQNRLDTNAYNPYVYASNVCFQNCLSFSDIPCPSGALEEIQHIYLSFELIFGILHV